MQIQQFFDKFGRRAHFEEPDGWRSTSFSCFLQPLRYKNKMYLNGINTQIGFNAQGHYLFIGPPDHDLTALSTRATLHIDGCSYLVDRAEKVYCGDKPYYIWAIVRTVVLEGEESL